jgi:hypothetical protein
MNNLITNQEESKSFSNLLNAYWMDMASSHTYSNDIYNYYKIDENLPFIDTEVNNSRAAILAMGCNDYDFCEFLLTSDKLKNKKHSLVHLAGTLEKNKYIDEKFAFLLLDCLENKTEMFTDYRLKTKKKLIGSCIEFLIGSGDLMDSEDNFVYKHQDEFLGLLKKFKINPYEEKYHIIESLISNGRIKTLDYLIDSAKKDVDKEKILYLPYDNAPSGVEEFLELKRKTHETYKNYRDLKNNLSQDDDKPKIKRSKI